MLPAKTRTSFSLLERFMVATKRQRMHRNSALGSVSSRRKNCPFDRLFTVPYSARYSARPEVKRPSRRDALRPGCLSLRVLYGWDGIEGAFIPFMLCNEASG